MNESLHLSRTLTWPEVRAAAERKATIVIPVAAIEQHGFHLPVDTDNVLVEHVTEEAARRIVNTTNALAASVAHWALAREAVDQLRESEFPGGMAHPCEFETALYMHIKPELVQTDKMTPRETPSRHNKFIYDDLFGSGPVHMVNRWSRVTGTGVEGDPMLATPEKGKAFAECTIGNLVEFARLFREMPRGADADLNHQSEAL